MIGAELGAGRLRFSLASGSSGLRMRFTTSDSTLELCELGACNRLDLPTWQEVASGGDLIELLSGANGAGYFSAAVALDTSSESATIEAALRFKTQGVSPAIAFHGVPSAQAARHGDGAVEIGPWLVTPLAASQVRMVESDAAQIVVAPTALLPEPPGTVCWGCRIRLTD